jgi:hypothetical protein
MRKNLASYLLFTAVAVIMFSCQKEDGYVAPDDKISSDNPAELSAALRVWHGKRTTGNAPAPTGNIPAIDPTINTEIRAFAGRYAIIQPEVLTGEIAGYYVGIQGAGQYFKVDFSAPRNIPGRTMPAHRQSLLSRRQGNADSSIVIVLPSNLQVPDTFCVTYCPYDPQGNIGQPVTTCIIVSSLGGDANSAWIQNEWRMTASWELIGGQREYLDTIIYNKWTAYGDYECYSDTSGFSFLQSASGSFPVVVSDSLYYRKANLRFATNGGMDYKDDADDKWVNVGSSTCTHFDFHFEHWADSVSGAWSYNSSTNKMILIFEFDDLGYPEPEVWEFDVIKVSDTHWILRDPWDDYYYRWQR